MSSPLDQCGEIAQRLYASVLQLEREGELLQLPPLDGREWFELLRRKLLPQLGDDAFLVAAVVGGTNIGKSVLFNHLAGSSASATSPLASGTKHPVCLVPDGFTQNHDLPAIFEGFELYEWSTAEAALEETDEHRLFWADNARLPDNLLLLDTPDIDSDARVNWVRADHIRRCADVLIAVLTQQKYNDAAVKQFFRQAAKEDKAVIVVFNQCQLPDDEPYWPLWLETFSRETAVTPEFVYLAPNDRRAAEENRLPLFERQWPVPSEEVSQSSAAAQSDEVHDLADDLSRLHFGDIKLRSLQGSLRQLVNHDSGVPVYLSEVEHRSAEFAAAARRLSSESVARINDWPLVSNKLLVQEIRRWWKTHQEGWARNVHAFYDAVGRGVTWPFRMAHSALGGVQTSLLDEYREREWSVLLKAVEEVFDKLTWMSESGNELLRPHFERLMEGRSRSALITRLREEHARVDLGALLEETVHQEMESLETDSPELYRFYKQLNQVSAAIRPATSVVMFTMGWGPAGELAAPFVADAAAQAIVPIVADFAGGTAAALAGETAVSETTSRGAGFLQAKIHRLQGRFAARRVGWLVGLLKEHLLGTLPDDLQAAAELPRSAVFGQIKETLRELEGRLEHRQHKTLV